MPNKNIAEASLELTYPNRREPIHIPLADILAWQGLKQMPLTATLALTRDNIKLEAQGNLENEYPGFLITAKDANGEPITLANAELPNADMPDTLTARLYAGYDAFETDCPIAEVETRLRTADEMMLMDRLNNRTGRGLTKLINVDYDLAYVQSWICTDEPLREHTAEGKNRYIRESIPTVYELTDKTFEKAYDEILWYLFLNRQKDNPLQVVCQKNDGGGEPVMNLTNVRCPYGEIPSMLKYLHKNNDMWYNGVGENPKTDQYILHILYTGGKPPVETDSIWQDNRLIPDESEANTN